MPVVFANPAYPNQTGFNGSQPVTTQSNFRQMIGEVGLWNPNVDPNLIGRWLNNYQRKLLDMRQWYGAKVRGQIIVPRMVNTGSASVTSGSNSVNGIGTSWDQSAIGLQFRRGFNSPYQTIVDVDVATQVLTLDMPFGGATSTGGYVVVSVYVTLGANIKYLLWASNQQQGWNMEVNGNVESLNYRDTWRQSFGWSTVLATRPPTPDGQFQVEIWPTPYANQVFPFEAYTQAVDMVRDDDSPLPFLRSDLLVTRTIVDAKLFGGRSDKYYDPVVASAKMAEFKEAVEQMENADNQIDQKDVTWDYGGETSGIGSGQGSTWRQSHDA